jgi:hypothetical protein
MQMMKRIRSFSLVALALILWSGIAGAQTSIDCTANLAVIPSLCSAFSTVNSNFSAISAVASSVYPSVAVVATGNLTLSGAQTVDGTAGTAGTTLVLATAQSTASQNGPWIMQTGAWTRPAWYPSGGTSQAIQFATTLARLGTVYQGSVWRQTAAAPITIDTTATTWVVTPLALNANTVSGTGLPLANIAPQTAYTVPCNATGSAAGLTDCTLGTGMSFVGSALTSSGSGGTVTNVATGAGLAGGPVTGTGTISSATLINAQTGTTYTVVIGDAQKLVTFSNSGAVAVTLPAATVTGFGTGFSFKAQNLGAGTATITPTTSTINGAATLGIATNTGCMVTSDGTNYQVSACTSIAAPLAPYTVLGNATGSTAAPSALSQAQIGTILGSLTYGAAPFPALVTAGTVYVPGDTITLTGGTFTAAAQILVGQTKAVSGTVNAGGSGGVNGACTVTATTGTGTAAQFTGTVTGNALAGALSVAVAGAYSANPTSLSAVPVTGCSLTGATVTVVMGVSSSTVITGGTYTATPANPAAQGSTSGSGSGATFTITWGTNGPNVPGTPLTLTQFGAKCDGTTDDTAAITKWALSAQPYTTLAIEPGVTCIFDPSAGGTATYGMNFQNMGHFVIEGNGATIKAKNSSSTSGNSFLMRFKNSTDIVIKDLILDGNIANRTITAIYGGDNVFIEDSSARILFDHVRFINSTKDGIDVTPDNTPTTQSGYPTDITLRDCDAVGNSRNGLSLIGSIRFSVKGGNYSSTTGEGPSAGIDIEPDATTLYGNSYVRIEGVDTSNNAGPGINAAGHSTSVTATSASPAVFTGLTVTNGTQVTLGGTAPTGFTAGTPYFVVATSGNTFELAATLGGTAINSSSTGTSVVAQVYSNHILIKNWSAQNNATYQLSLNGTIHVEVDGAFISNVSATPPSNAGLLDLNSDAGLYDISFRNLHFNNITSGNGALIHTSAAVLDRLFVDGMKVNNSLTALFFTNSPVTIENVEVKNLSVAAGMQILGANATLRNFTIDTDTGYPFYCNAANLLLENWVVKDWTSASQAFSIAGSCTGLIANNITAIQSTSVPGPVWTFSTPPKQITNFVAKSAGTDFTTATAWPAASTIAGALIVNATPAAPPITAPVGQVGEYWDANCNVATSGASQGFTLATPTVGTWSSPPWTSSAAVPYGSFACPFFISANAPAGLSANTTYWAVPINATTFHVSTTAALAMAGTFAAASGSSSTANLTSSTYQVATTTVVAAAAMKLTAGEWKCQVTALFIPQVTTSVTNLESGVSASSTAIGNFGTYNDFETAANVLTATNNPTLSSPLTDLLITSATAEYGVAEATFTLSTMNEAGDFNCTRVH